MVLVVFNVGVLQLLAVQLLVYDLFTAYCAEFRALLQMCIAHAWIRLMLMQTLVIV